MLLATVAPAALLLSTPVQRRSSPQMQLLESPPSRVGIPWSKPWHESSGSNRFSTISSARIDKSNEASFGASVEERWSPRRVPIVGFGGSLEGDGLFAGLPWRAARASDDAGAWPSIVAGARPRGGGYDVSARASQRLDWPAPYQQRQAPWLVGGADRARSVPPSSRVQGRTYESSQQPNIARQAAAQRRAQAETQAQSLRRIPTQVPARAQTEARAEAARHAFPVFSTPLVADQSRAHVRSPPIDGKVRVALPGGKVPGDRFTVQTAWGWATGEVPVGATAGQMVLVRLPRTAREAASLASVDTLSGPGPTR